MARGESRFAECLNQVSIPFSMKLAFALKALSISRGRLATEMAVDKSVVGRWLRGVVRPSGDNLTRLTGLVALRVDGFSVLDWERDLPGLAEALGVDPATAPGAGGWRLGEGPHGPVIEQAIEATTRRGDAYEGIYRSTRPYASYPGLFMHDHMLVRRDEAGLLRFDLRSDSVRVLGWVLPQQHQLFIVGTENATGSLAFGILNGVSATRAERIDGLLLACALDAGRTPTSCAIVLDRVADLTDDPDADEERFSVLAKGEALAPKGSVPAALQAHLTRDIGPAQLAIDGDWLLRLPLSRSLSRGPTMG